MTASELVEKYKIEITSRLCYEDDIRNEYAKQCALIDIQNTIDALEDSKEYIDDNSLFEFNNVKIKEYNLIKQAIENYK